jgi:GrpB protein
VAFRDYLREHPAAAREYEDLKRDLAGKSAATNSESREAYAQAKTDFIERIVAMALNYGYPREFLRGDAAQLVGPERIQRALHPQDSDD